MPGVVPGAVPGGTKSGPDTPPDGGMKDRRGPRDDDPTPSRPRPAIVAADPDICWEGGGATERVSLLGLAEPDGGLAPGLARGRARCPGCSRPLGTGFAGNKVVDTVPAPTADLL